MPRTIRVGGGPRSPEGKKVTSRNAVKHGAYSDVILLPGEDAEEYKAHLRKYIDAFAPEDAVEESLVHKLVDIDWKRKRLLGLESFALQLHMDAPIRSVDFAGEKIQPSQACDWLLADLSIVTDDDHVGEQVKLQRSILDLPPNNLVEEVCTAIPSEHPELFEAICDLACQRLDLAGSELTMPELRRRRIQVGSRPEEPFLLFALREIFQKAHQIIWVSMNLEAIMDAIARIKRRRLLEAMQWEGPARVEDDLSRAYSKTLKELCGYQDWRRKHPKGILVVPESESDLEAGALAATVEFSKTD